MKDYHFLILIILSILALSFGAWWQFQSFQKSMSELKLPKFEMPKMKLPEAREQEKKEEKEFVSPDKKLKIKYPGDWTEEKNKEFLKAFNRGRNELPQAKTIFVAYKIIWENPLPSFLLCQEISLTTPEKVIEAIKKANNPKIEIIAKKEKEVLFEADYQRKREPPLLVHSREKVISTPEKSYLVAIFSIPENWSKLSSDVQFIFDSIEIVK